MSKTKIRLPSKAEDAAITSAAKSDIDNPPMTDAQLKQLRPLREMFPDLAAYSRRKGRLKEGEGEGEM